MKRFLTQAFFDYMTGRVAKTLARCWLVETVRGVKYGFTSHTRNLTYDGLLYNTALGLQMADLRSMEGPVPDTTNVSAFLSVLDEKAISAGVFDQAFMEIFLVNYHNLGLRKITEKVGYLGEISRADGLFSAELRGLTQVLDTKIGRIYAISCDAVLGDNRCKVNLLGNPAWFKTGTVADVTSESNFVVSESYDDDFFTQGSLHFTTGANTGFARDIRVQKGDTIITYLPFPYPVKPGDGFQMTAGCDKKPATCIGKFNNKANFRGFDFVPTNEDVFYSPLVNKT